MHALLGIWLLALAGPRAGILPSGTYHYGVYSEGKIAGSSTITIVHEASAVTVKETVDVRGNTARTTRSLDPATFSTRSWSWFGPDDRVTESVTFSKNDAAYKQEKTTTSIAAAAADAPAALFDLFGAEFAALPAMIHATGASRYNEYYVGFGSFDVKAIAVVAATAARPPAVPSIDRAIALSSEGNTITLWYDPNTFILRELDFSAERISFILLG